MSKLRYKGKHYFKGFSKGLPTWTLLPHKALVNNTFWLHGVADTLCELLDFEESDFEIDCGRNTNEND